MPNKRTLCSTAAVAVAVGLVFGCSKSEPAVPQPDTPAAQAPDDGLLRHSYTVRGLVVVVPSAGRPMDDLEIRHEAIPDYKTRDGTVFVNSKGVTGMGSMTMGFPVAEGVSLEGIDPGDKIEFVLVTTWGETYPDYAVTEIRELPADTELNFGG
jgi:hypothetical protein